MRRRSLAVVIAFVLAFLASTVAYVQLHSAQQQADKNAMIRSVYVLRKAVPEGVSVATALSEGYIEATKTPSQFAPAQATTSLAAIRNYVSFYPLLAGEVLVNSMFVSPRSIGSVAAKRVPSGDVAVSVTADQVHSVGGSIQPGDKVDIMVDIDGLQERFLYQSVPVMAVGMTLVPVPSRTPTPASEDVIKPSNVITFAVPPAFAARIAQASGGGGVTGGVYLALDPAGTASVPTAPVSLSNPIFASPLIGQHVHTSGTDERTP